MRRLISVILVSAWAVDVSGADAITLKDGAVVQGSVIRFEKGRFTIDDGGEKPRTIRVTDIETVEFEQPAGGVAPVVAAPKDAAPQGAAEQLQGDDLDAWKLARSHISSNHEIWMPDNAMPVRGAIQITPTGDYLVAIPVATKPEPGFGQQYGIFLVQVTKFGASLRVDGDSFQKTQGPFRPRPAGPARKGK